MANVEGRITGIELGQGNIRIHYELFHDGESLGKPGSKYIPNKTVTIEEAKQQIAQEAKDWDDKFAATPAIAIKEGDIITAADLAKKP